MPQPVAMVSSYPVLYVDDEAENLVTFRYAVEERFRVLTASSGQEALRLLEQEEIAVLLSDQRMPGMSGVELCEAARRLRPDVVRIIITAYSDLQVAVDAINRGQVARYLTKPWRDDELLSLLDTSIDLVRLQQTMRDMQVRLLQQGEPRAIAEQRTELARHLATPLAQLSMNAEQVRDLLDAGIASWEDPQRARELVGSARSVHEEIDAPLHTLRETAARLGRRERLGGRRSTPACDAARVVRAVCSILERGVRGVAELRVVLRASPSVPMEAAQLGHVLTQLVQSAAAALSRAPARDGLITVTVDQEGGAARISVEDNGPALGEAQLSRVFDPHCGPLGSSGEGGVGLALVERLVSEVGGRVEARGLGDRGQRFELCFPTASG